MQNVASLLMALDQRRRDLGLSYDLLSKRCGVSNVLAIAESLGLALRFDSEVAPRELKREQAERKAKRLVALVQGTSGLEGQAVDPETVASMIERTTDDLLAGSKRRLWSEE
jgi:hypothetical protein